MILTIGFSIVLFLSIWAYFMFVGVMNYTKNQDNLETPLPGRPARRTIGRINSDVEKSIFAIFVSYVVFIMAFYGTLEYSRLLPEFVMTLVVLIGGGFMTFLMTPANRRAHAYMNIGQISVIHVVSSLSVFFTLEAVLNERYLSFNEMGSISLIVLGVMMTYSRLIHRDKVKK
jgi:uncharacterized protein (DUF486 family)